jgi:apolipoprotein N-acyltransferase
VSALDRFTKTLQDISAWRRWLAAFTAGALSALGFAPLDLFPLLLLGFALLMLLLDGVAAKPHPVRNGAVTAWFFGFGQFMVGMHWIFYPFLVDPIHHAWQIPFVALLFPGGLALFMALAGAATMLLWRKGVARILILAVCYSATEWLRGHVLTGLPWNLPAYAWGASLPVMQSSAVIGPYGLSLLTVLFGASLADLARRKWLMPATMMIAFALLWAAGATRLALATEDTVAGVQLRLVQPDIPQDEKYKRRFVLRNWSRLVELTMRKAKIMPTVIIWPEAAPPFLLQQAPEAVDQIGIMLGPNRALVTGNQRMVATNRDNSQFFNSLFVFARGGQLTAIYDKFHLVPFGEYMPMTELATALGFTKLVNFPGSFAAGDGPHTLEIPGAPQAGPLICYEILFPDAIVGETRPGWLINVTDDSWFGPWAGPRQHLLTAQFRAIEQGLPIARAANTGISAVIDPYGRQIAKLDLDTMGVVDAALPQALTPTIYARFGDIGFLLLLILFTVAAWIAPLKRA